jgi:CheY-like chemotaxis protein/cell division protein FtsB
MQLSTSSPLPAVTERFHGGLRGLREQADARIFWLLITQWAVILLTSIVVSARWANARLDSLASPVLWVGVLSLLPLAAVLRSPGRWQARWSVGLSQALASSLLWYASGGRADTHLHLFTWLVVLALYRDIAVLLTTVAAALLGHALLLSTGILPIVDDPAQGFTHLVWLAWLVGFTAFLTTFILLDRESLASQIERDHALESLQAEFRGKVEENARTLVEERDALNGQIRLLTEQRTSLDAARVELSRELLALRRDVMAHATAIVKQVGKPVDSSLPKPWQSQWQSLRKQAQRLQRLVEYPVMEQDDSGITSSDVRLSQASRSPGRVEVEKRAMLMMRNPLQQAKAIAALESEGYKVDVVLNGPRTYYSVMLNDYSVIVVDVDLPDDEGYDTLEALQLLPPDQRGLKRHLFAVTSSMTPERVLRCTDLGVDGMFLKPLQAGQLQKSLREATSVRPAREETKSSCGSSNSALRRST